MFSKSVSSFSILSCSAFTSSGLVVFRITISPEYLLVLKKSSIVPLTLLLREESITGICFAYGSICVYGTQKRGYRVVPLYLSCLSIIGQIATGSTRRLDVGVSR